MKLYMINTVFIILTHTMMIHFVCTIIILACWLNCDHSIFVLLSLGLLGFSFLFVCFLLYIFSENRTLFYIKILNIYFYIVIVYTN